jgi:dolichol-phosphate mannosyltransferase
MLNGMKKDSLAVVLPVYNEEGSIANVLSKWVKALDKLGIDYNVHVYNDGSTDDSLTILRKYAAPPNSKVTIHDKTNSGHGPTILKGYRDNANDYEWIFQIDSDDEMGSESFNYLWEERSKYDLLIGIRNGRRQPLPRKIVSLVSRLSVRAFYGKSVWDVNSPYRLMRTEKFKEFYQKIPKDTFAPNVILSGFVGRAKLRFFEYPVSHCDRQTGEVSIKKWKLIKVAIKSLKQTVMLSYQK